MLIFKGNGMELRPEKSNYFNLNQDYFSSNL